MTFSNFVSPNYIANLAALSLLSCLTVACSDSDGGGNDGGIDGDVDGGGATCEGSASQALQVCVGAVNDAWGACYDSSDAPCDDDDATTMAALDALEQAVRADCSDGDFAGLSTDAVVARWRYACESEADSIAWRTFGGPHGAVWPTLDAAGQACLSAAHDEASALTDASLGAINSCLATQDCDDAAIQAAEQSAADAAATAIATACGDLDLEDAIAVSPQIYAARALEQVDCLTAISRTDVGTLSLNCGPSNAVADPPRGQYMRIELDGDKWGTICGDGSPYSFHIRLAPEGSPIDRVIIGLQGGGVCFFEDDCTARFNGSGRSLFMASDDEPLEAGIASNDPIASPFGNWTKVYLPYCNQDVFAAGGIVQEFAEFDLHRSGAINLRSAIRATRDILWEQLDAEGGAGYRPDEIVTLFGGWSAGGYGALYNYHWLLDDLLWPRTAAFPDAGMALDNGEVLLGVRGFGNTLIPTWGTLPFLPPYCFSGDCAVGTDNYTAISPRLKTVPEQQYLILSNQKDTTQQGDAFFGGDEAGFVNAMRKSYCDAKDLPGVHFYLTTESMQSTHVVTLRDEFYNGAVAGVVMKDWLWGAVNDPDNVPDIAAEGTVQTDIPGVEPFMCALP